MRTSRARRASPGFPRCSCCRVSRAASAARPRSGNTDATLCDRVAREAGWAGLTFTFRGTGPSEGDFSIDGWLADVRAAVDALDARADVTGVWIAGFRLGGTLAIVTAAGDERVRGIATFAAPASLRTWVREPEWFLDTRAARACCAVEGYPPDPDAWIRAIAQPRSDRRRAPRGARDRGCSCTAAPTTSCPSRMPAGSPRRPAKVVELRIVANGPHRLRHDPRAIAALLGWLDHQKA